MKNLYKFSICFLLLIFSFEPALAQRESLWEQAPQKLKNKNSFKRMEWFYRQRALPLDTIPYYKFYEIKQNETKKYSSMKKSQSNLANWVSVGPVGINSSFPAQWGVVSGRIRSVAIHPTDPDIVYIGAAAGGIWKTTNGGTSWSDIGADLESLTFGAIAIDPIDPNNIYAGTGESMYFFNLNTYTGNGIFKSTDAGTTWTNISTSFGSKTQFSSINVSPNNSDVAFASMGRGNWLFSNPGNGGVWRTSDGGITWLKTLTANDAFDVLPHPTQANRVYAGVGGAVSVSGFYYSTNDGVNWTKATTGLPTASNIGRIQIALSTTLPNNIYAAIYRSNTNQTEIYKSTNDGLNWAQISSGVKLGGTYDGTNWSDQGWYDLCIAVDPIDANKVFIGNVELHKTTNGSSFAPVRNAAGPFGGTNAWDSPMHVDYHQIAYAPSNPNIIYAGTDGGIHKSTNGGTTWFSNNNGLSTIQLYRVAGSPLSSNVILGGAQDNGVFITATGGVGNWDLVGTGDGMELFFHPTNSLTAYVSTQYGSLYRTTDGGNNISNITPNFTQGDVAWTAPFFMHPTNPSWLYAASKKVYRSTNSGNTWTALTASNVTSSIINTMAQSPVDPDNMSLVGGEYDVTPTVHTSTDGGFVWNNITSNLPGPARYISRVVFHPTESNTFYVVRSGFGSGKIYKTTNMGAAWTNISSDLPDIPHNDLFVDPEQTDYLYAANDLGVYLSTDAGTNWVRQGNNMPYVPAIDFDYVKIGSERLLRVGTHGRSVFQVNLNDVVPVELTSFTASAIDGKILLNWETATETNNYGFEIERSMINSDDEKGWSKIAFVSGFGTTSEKKNYSFEDMPGSGKYAYRLKQIDLDRTFEYSNSIEIDFASIRNYELAQNYPNPFNPSTKISYYLPVEGIVKLTVYNTLGEKIQMLVNEQKEAGAYEALLNGENLSSGIYFYNIEVNANGKILYKDSKKMILNK